MFLKKEQWPVFVAALVMVIAFTIVFVSRANYEFMSYIGVIIFFFLLILFTNKKVDYPLTVLWGLVTWGFLHLSGGAFYFGEERLYEIILIPLVGAPYYLFRYDHFVHMIGFMVATFLMYALLKPLLKKSHNHWWVLSIVVVMAGLGAGALNEIIEFFAVVALPATGVGGYENTSLDLVFNLMGAVLAMLWIWWKERR